MTVELTASRSTSKPQHVARHERILGLGALIGLLWVCVQALSVLSGPGCPSSAWFGVPCAGCGMTRSLWATLSMQASLMLRLHPAAPVVLLAMIVHACVFVVSLGRAQVYQAPVVRRTLRWLRWSAFVAAVVVGALRAILVAAGVIGWDVSSGAILGL